MQPPLGGNSRVDAAAGEPAAHRARDKDDAADGSIGKQAVAMRLVGCE